MVEERPTLEKVTGRGAFRGSALTSVWTLFSRILGFVRDAMMTATFGMSPVFGSFSVAWVLPNLFRRLFGEGAVGAAVQPALAREREEKGEEAAKLLYRTFVGWTGMALIALVLIGEVLLFFWMGVASEKEQLVLLLAALLLPYSIPICLSALATAPQHMSGRFLAPAAAPVILNLVWIGALLVAEPKLVEELDGTAISLSLALLAGGILQYLVQLPGVRAAGFPMLPHAGFRSESGRRTVRDFLPAFVALAGVQINMALDQALVWGIVGAEANSFAYLSNRLLQLPLALIGIAVATGTLPLFARLSAEGRFEELSFALRNAVEGTLLLIVAAAAGLWVLAPDVLTVLFDHGRYDSADTPLLTETLRAYLWCLPGATLAGLLTRVRQSRGDYRGPAIIAGISIPVNLGLDIYLLPKMGVPGAGWATAVALSLQAALLLSGLRGLEIRKPILVRRLPKLLGPAIAAAWVAGLFSAWLGEQSATIPGICVCIGSGVLAAVAASAILLPGEIRSLFRGNGRT